MVERLPPPPPEGFVRIRMRVAYDGSGFSGFMKNPEARTIEGALEEALTESLRHPVTLSCAGRTDKGVHARGQVVAFDADAAHVDANALGRALNRKLGPEIAVDRIEEAPPTFDARLSCTARSYRYHVLNRPVGDPLRRHVTWHVPQQLNVEAMAAAAGPLVGLHDFTAFSKKNKSRPTEVFLRRVHSAEWVRADDIVRFDITANAFTHQMVRSLVGMLVAIGLGRREVADLDEVLRGLDRSAAPSPAPPGGLVLWEAHYD
ncbi:MAG: tRNA pseudouridine(38-40) synthase TruA [Acidimicrobiales bacterium]